MNKNEIIDFHKVVLSNYLEFWNSKEEAVGFGVTKGEAAYSVLEHSGMLYRYTADRKYIEKVKQFDLEEILMDAFDYIEGMTIAESINDLINSDEISEFDMDDAEILIRARDGLETALNVISDLVKSSVYSGDFRYLDKLTNARLKAHEFDNAIESDIALITVATRGVAKYKEYIEVELSEKDYWWFYRARELDEEVETRDREFAESINSLMDNETLRNRLLSRILVRNRAFKSTVASIRTIAGEFKKAILERSTISSSEVPLAAASDDSIFSPVVVWCGFLPKFKEPVTVLNIKDVTDTEPIYASLLTKLRRLDDKITGQWSIKGSIHHIQPGATFLLCEKDSGDILGEGTINERFVATLLEGSWDQLVRFENNTSGLFLLIIDLSNDE